VTPAAADSVGRVVDGVFRGDEYNRVVQETLWNQMMAALDRFLSVLWQRFWQWLYSIPGGEHVVKGALYVIALIVVVVAGYYIITYFTTRHRGEPVANERAVRDLWKASEQSAARGDYTGAAHLLYASLLHTLMGRGAVRFHPSKTAGDYARELARRSGTFHAPFAAFVRAYDVVIYRDGMCDQPHYQTLRSLAEPIIRPMGIAA
jgi:hypothetical protein